MTHNAASPIPQLSFTADDDEDEYDGAFEPAIGGMSLHCTYFISLVPYTDDTAFYSTDTGTNFSRHDFSAQASSASSPAATSAPVDAPLIEWSSAQPISSVPFVEPSSAQPITAVPFIPKLSKQQIKMAAALSKLHRVDAEREVARHALFGKGKNTSKAKPSSASASDAPPARSAAASTTSNQSRRVSPDPEDEEMEELQPRKDTPMDLDDAETALDVLVSLDEEDPGVAVELQRAARRVQKSRADRSLVQVRLLLYPRRFPTMTSHLLGCAGFI